MGDHTQKWKGDFSFGRERGPKSVTLSKSVRFNMFANE